MYLENWRSALVSALLTMTSVFRISVLFRPGGWCSTDFAVILAMARHIYMLADSLPTVILSYLFLRSVLGSPDAYDVPIPLSE